MQPDTPGTSEYLLDIDTAWDIKPLDDSDQIIAYVEKLHEIAGAIFESLITDETRQLLNAD